VGIRDLFRGDGGKSGRSGGHRGGWTNNKIGHPDWAKDEQEVIDVGRKLLGDQGSNGSFLTEHGKTSKMDKKEKEGRGK